MHFSTKLPTLKITSPEVEKIDRMGWAAGFSLRSYGMSIGVRSNDLETLERALDYLPHRWSSTTSRKVDRVYSIMRRNGESSNGRRDSTLYRDDRRLARTAVLDDLLGAFESDLRLFIAEFARDRVFVHAGVVGWKGHAIVIPGRSYSGKSSLVAELVRSGATYYSDEYAVFDSQGRVHPFTKPIELRLDGTYKQTRVDVGELGGRAGRRAIPVGLVLITGYKDGASWRPAKLTAGKGVLEILFNTVSARSNPESAFVALRRVAEQAEILKGVRGDATHTVPAILSRLEKRISQSNK